MTWVPPFLTSVASPVLVSLIPFVFLRGHPEEIGLSRLLVLRGERRFKGLRQIGCFASAPIMQKKDARVLVRHVTVNRHDVDPVMAKGSQHRLQLIFEY